MGAPCSWTRRFGVAYVLLVFGMISRMYSESCLRRMLKSRQEGELDGLDLHEHGISAYPEYVITQLGTPQGLSMHVDK